MKFTKMQGIGNDYVYVNCFEETVEDPCETAKMVSDRHFGIGSDGLILIKPSDVADCQMDMYNLDGSRGAMCGNGIALEATVTNSSPISPPPFMVGAAEVEVDLETGEAKVIDYAAAVDCGTPVKPNLARVQAEGGILQGIGMALTENITYNKLGKLAENSLMQYKIPTRVDIGKIRVDFESSYENEGPFGAKSIGEVVINTPLPAVADAIYNATGTRFYELPITPEKIAMAVRESK